MTSRKRSGCLKIKGKAKYPACINSKYFGTDFKESFNSSYVNTKEFHDTNSSARIIPLPFKTCILPNFIDNLMFIKELKKELEEQIFYEKNNDLYKFEQTADFKGLPIPYGRNLRKLFKNELRHWLSEVTGIQLNDRLDMTGSKYEYTDVLLCHDDELDTRRIAFILYLVPTWKEEYGGTLDLFDTDEYNRPRNIVKSLVPCENQFTFFEVAPNSYHQVSEVICKAKTRLSINGWFHGTPIKRLDPYLELPLNRMRHIEVNEDIFRSWINPTYLDSNIQIQIKEKFEANSEIELKDFLSDEKFTLLEEALKANELIWKQTGPVNHGKYFVLDLHDENNNILKEFNDILKSEAFFLTLSNLTGLKLHKLAVFDSSTDEDDDEMQTETDSSQTTLNEKDEVNSESKRIRNDSTNEMRPNKISKVEEKFPTCTIEIRKWKHGCYTLNYDSDKERSAYALDLTFYFLCQEWKTEYGGHSSFIAKDEDDELLTINPNPNSLAIVYKDKQTMKFVKYVNHKVNDRSEKEFFDVNAIYYE